MHLSLFLRRRLGVQAEVQRLGVQAVVQRLVSPYRFKNHGIYIQVFHYQSWFCQIFSFFVVSLNLCIKICMWVLHHAVLCHFVTRDTYLVNMLLQELDISQGSVLYAVDEATVRSLNGCRVADRIIRLVPNIEVDMMHQIHMFSFNCLFPLQYLNVLILCIFSYRIFARH
jgi:hypothetical protein